MASNLFLLHDRCFICTQYKLTYVLVSRGKQIFYPCICLNIIPIAQTKELLAELVMVEEEISQLERQISKVQEGLVNIQGDQEQDTQKVVESLHENRNVAKPASNIVITDSKLQSSKLLQEKIALETKPLFFINQAIKGDFLVNGLSKKGNVGRLNKYDQHKEYPRLLEVKEGASRRDVITEKASSAKLPIKHLTDKVSLILRGEDLLF